MQVLGLGQWWAPGRVGRHSCSSVGVLAQFLHMRWAPAGRLTLKQASPGDVVIRNPPMPVKKRAGWRVSSAEPTPHPVTPRSLPCRTWDSGYTLVHPFRALGKNSELLLVSDQKDVATWQRGSLPLRWASGLRAQTEAEANHTRCVHTPGSRNPRTPRWKRPHLSWLPRFKLPGAGWNSGWRSQGRAELMPRHDPRLPPLRGAR